MKRHAIVTVWLKELRDHLRDRRTALMVFLLSIAMGPLVLMGMSWFIASIEAKAEKREIYVEGIHAAPSLANFLARQGMTVLAPKTDFRHLIQQGKHDPVLVIPTNFEEQFQTGQASVELVFDDTRNDAGRSVTATHRRLLTLFNRETISQRLVMRGISPAVLQPVDVQNINLGTATQRAAGLLFIIPWMTLLVGVSGCVAISIDMTAGERERGSLEPLLMNPVSRHQLIFGKWAAVVTWGWGIVFLMLLGFWLTLTFAPLPKLGTVISLSIPQYLGFAALLLPFTPAMGALQMLIATYGRSFKEAQTYVSYLVSAVSMVPAIGLIAQLKDESWQLFVPMLGQLMVMTRLLRGETIEPIHFLLPMIVCFSFVLASLWLMVRLLGQERIIFGRQ